MKSNKFREFGQTAQQDAPIVQPIYVTEGSGAIVVIAITLFSVVVMYVTSRNSESAWSSIWGTVIFFSLALPTGLMAANGTFGAMFRVWQEQRTIVILNRPASRLEVIDSLQIPHEESAPLALPQHPNFVPATPPADARLKLSCVEFVTALFDDNGTPNPRRILGEHTRRPGQIQASKPKPEVVEYLTALYMTWTEEDGMLFFATHYYPTLHDAIAAIKRGTPAGVGGTPPIENPYPHPHYTGEGGAQ